MGTNAKSDPSWIDRLKTRGVLALSTVAAALGFGLLNTSPPAPSPTPSSRAAQAAQDPVSPDGHYTTWSAYLDSITCNLERHGYAPATRSICSPLFAVARTSDNSPARSSDPSKPANASLPKTWINDDTHYMSEPIDMVDFTERVAIAREQIKSHDPKVAYEGYVSIETFLIAKDSPPAMRRMTAELVGSEDAFYKDFDAAIKRYSDIDLIDVQQRIGTQQPDQLSVTERCAILKPLHTYINLLQARINFRTYENIKDDQVPNLERLDRWARDLSDQLSNNEKLVCKISPTSP